MSTYRKPFPSLIKIGAITISMLICLAPTIGEGHPGHGGPITQDEAAMLATAQVSRLVEERLLEKSWNLAQIERIEKRSKDRSSEFAVVFLNPYVSDDTKSVLYVFLTDFGEYVASNYSGR